MIPLLLGCFFVVGVVSGTTTTTTTTPPNIIFILTDDLGWNYPGYHNPEVQTPNLDSLAASGVRLESHYTYKYCAPTRGSFLTGRYPYHLAATRCNFIPSSIPEGINLGYKMLPAKLAEAGFISHHIGKWHLGFHVPEYTPVARGFNTSYGFLEGGENHYTHWCGAGHVDCNVIGKKKENGGWDLWSQSTDDFPGKPLYGMNGTATQWSGSSDTYSGYIFTQQAVNLIHQHKNTKNQNSPMFMYLALHNTHAPIEAPERFINLYQSNDTKKNVFSAMVSVVDESVKNITDALKLSNMWENTLLVWTTDNGSPVQVGGSNHPLRGGKGGNLEGGVRTPTFIAGGVVPKSMKGKQLNGMVHVADWYSVFTDLAGLGGKADPAGPAPSDSLNIWPYLSGRVSESPRTELVYDHHMFTNASAAESCNGQDPFQLPGYSALGALRMGPWKLIVGPEHRASWYGAFSPNVTTHPDLDATACVDHPCLFNLIEDPGEHIDRYEEEPEQVKKMMQRFKELESTYHPAVLSPPRMNTAFCAAIHAHHGFVAPYAKP